MSEDVIFFVVLGAVIVTVIIFVLARMPRGAVAEVAVKPGVPFELRCSPANAKEHRVCLEYALVVPGRDPELFGIACAITAETADKQVLDEVVGVGYRARAAGSITTEAKARFRGSTTRLAESCKVSQTAVLIALGPRPHASEIVLRGRISTPDDVTVEAMRIAITR